MGINRCARGGWEGLLQEGGGFGDGFVSSCLVPLLVPGNSDGIVYSITLLNCADFARGAQQSMADDTLGRGIKLWYRSRQ